MRPVLYSDKSRKRKPVKGLEGSKRPFSEQWFYLLKISDFIRPIYRNRSRALYSRTASWQKTIYGLFAGRKQEAE